MVDLSEKPRVVVELRLGDETFRITRVVVAVRHLYGEFLKEGGALMEKVGEVKALEDRFGGAQTDEENLRITAEIEAITKEVEHFSEQKIDQLFSCIELLLTRNGYEFDRAWWMDNADDADLQGFIVECVMKDTAGKKKTEEEAASTGGA